MDALMHYRQFCRNFIYSTSPWLVWIFLGGGVFIATALCGKHKNITTKRDKEESQA